MKIHFVMVVWGAPYIDLMVNIALPTLLAPGNLPALGDLSKSEFAFYTREEEEETIRSSPSVLRLSALTSIVFRHIDTRGEGDKYRGPGRVTKYAVMSKAHQEAGRRAREEAARAIFLAPDMIFADGAIQTLGDLMRDRRRAVMVLGPRLLQETGVAALKPALQQKRGEPLAIRPRDLVQFALDHLHPDMQCLFLDSAEFSLHPTMCLWSMGARGFLARAFHLHPLMIDFAGIDSVGALSRDTVDGDFVGSAIGRWDDIHVVTDSDDLFICSFSPGAVSAGRQPNVATLEQVRKLAFHSAVNPLHRMFFTKAVRIHTTDLDDDWRRVEEATGLWAFEVLKMALPRQRRSLLAKISGGLRRLKPRSSAG